MGIKLVLNIKMKKLKLKDSLNILLNNYFRKINNKKVAKI
jgi:hypothetical protein